MRRINKVVLIFFLFTLATFFVVIEVLQSDTMARSITKAVNKITEDRYGTRLEVEKLEFKLFPPGIVARNIKIDHKSDLVQLKLQSFVVGAFIDLRDVFLEKPTISEVLLSDVSVDLKIIEKEKRTDQLSKIEITKIIKQIDESLPINLLKINLSNLQLKYNDMQVDLEKVLLKKRKESIKLVSTLYNIKLAEFIKYQQSIDEINLTAVITDEKINIKDIKILNGITELNGKGSVANNFENIIVDGNINIDTDISVVDEYVDLSKIGTLNYGKLKLLSSVKVRGSDYNVTTKISLNDFLTDFCFGDSLQTTVKINKEKVLFENFKLKKNKQELELVSPFSFYNFAKKEFVEDTVALKVSSMKLNNALYFLRKDLSILNATVSGDLLFDLKKNGFELKGKDINIKELYLGESKKPILGFAQGNLKETIFKLNGSRFSMITDVSLPNTNFQIKGHIDGKDISFETNEGSVDLSDFYKFAGFDVKGRGSLKLNVSSTDGNVIKLDPELTDFNFEGYKLSKIKTKLYFDLNKDSIYVNDLQGMQGKAFFKGDARINYNNLKLQTNIEVNSKRFLDIKNTLNPLIGNISFIPNDIYGDWNIKTEIKGRATLDDIVVNNKITGENNYIYDESFEKISFNLDFENQVVDINKIYLKKSIGNAKGKLKYSLKDESLEYALDVKNIPIKELSIIDKSPIDIEAIVDGRFSGNTSKNKKEINTQVSMRNTFIAGRKIRDTSINSLIENDDYKFNLNLFGGELLVDANVFADKKKESSIKLQVDTQDIPLYFSVLRFVDKSTLNIDGRVRMSSSLSFPGLNYNKSNFSLLLSEFLFKKDKVNINYNYRSSNPQFLIENGVVKNWDLELEGRKFYLVSKGFGDLKSKFDITNSFKVDASILETFNKLVSKSNGTIRGRLNFYNKDGIEDYDAKIISNNLSFSTTFLPTEVKNTRLEIDYKNKTFFIKSLLARLSAGDVSLGGSIGISNVVPEFNLKLKVKDAGFPVLRKSNLVISGDTTIIGNKPPYTIAGDIIIDKLLIVNDINDFTTGKDAIIKKQFDYLPSDSNKNFDNFLNFNINISTKEAMRLSNSFADVGMVGDLQLLGGDSDPKLVGSLELAPRINKITFKNNEYTLSKGNVFFYQQNKIQNPELDFVASTNINDYKINLKVYGPVKTFNLDLSSTPALAQEDILSLIAFGYTKDLSANLTDAERESMTQAGVGSILFDSFKINETLKSEFGLQVNLGTQIQQNETSLLNQRNADSTRVRSATTIEVKKKLSEAMSLSVSSTVGGSAGQRQSMNLNYNISNKVSVEGVYETRTAPEGEEAIINDTSLGADVKWRWSFK